MKVKKETVYTLPYQTEEEIAKAVELRSTLYDDFDDVQVYPNGLYEVRVIATEYVEIDEYGNEIQETN